MKKKRFRHTKKIIKWLYYFTEAMVALILILAGLTFWLLYTKPMDANFLLPEISKQLLPADVPYTVEVDSSLLYAIPNEKGVFHLNIKNFSILKPDKTPVLTLPEVNLSYGLLHVLTLNYLPDHLEVINPSLHMTINDSGAFISQDSDQNSSSSSKATLNFNSILKQVLSFDELHLINGQVQLDDLTVQQSLSIPRFSLVLKKEFGFLHKARLSGITRIHENLLDFHAHASFSKFKKELSLELNLPRLIPSDFAKHFPLLNGIDIPISLIARGQFSTKQKTKNFADALTKLKFQIKSLKPGKLQLPSPIENTYSVKSLEINGGASDAFKVFKIAQSPFALTNGIAADLNLSVKGLNSFFHSWNVNDISTILEANVYNAKMEDVPKVWPAEQGPSAHQWVKEHLSKGKASKAYFKLDFKGSELVDVFGDIQAQNVRVDYLPPMPAIDDVSAQVLLYPKEVRILASAGHIQDVSLTSADLIFHDVDVDTTWTEMTINTQGPVRQTLQIVESKPLQFMTKFEVPYQKLSGTNETHLYLKFPLLDDLQPEQIHVQVQSSLINTAYQTDIPNFVANNGVFLLNVTNAGLDLNGHIQVQKQDVQLQWKEDFATGTKIPSKYYIQTNAPTKTWAPIIPDIEKYLDGKVGIKMDFAQTDKTTWQGQIQADLDAAKVVLYPVSRTKPKNKPAKLTIDFKDVSSNMQKGAAAFNLKGEIAKAEDLDIAGAISWNNGINLTLNNVIASGNQFSGNIQTSPKMFFAKLRGKKWDISNLSDMPIFQETSTEAKTKSDVVPDIIFDVNLDVLTLNPKHPLEKLQFQGKRTGKLWDTFHLQATASKPFVVVYEPQTHKFQGSFGDFGALLKYLTGQDRFKEGIVSLEAKQDTNGLIQGHISIDKITISEPGFLIQAATILGIVDAFRDNDITMDKVHIPFSIDPWHTIQLEDAYAAGSTLGVTVKGSITTQALDLSGSVIPAYAINSLPGKIPLLGALFKSEEGGGLIGVKYSVDGSLLDPQVHFHPLTSVLPGALGRVF